MAVFFGGLSFFSPLEAHANNPFSEMTDEFWAVMPSDISADLEDSASVDGPAHSPGMERSAPAARAAGTDRYIVKYKSGKRDSFLAKVSDMVETALPVSVPSLSEVSLNPGKSRVSGNSRGSFASSIEVLILPEKILPSEFAAALAQTAVSNDIEYIQPDYPLSLAGLFLEEISDIVGDGDIGDAEGNDTNAGTDSEGDTFDISDRTNPGFIAPPEKDEFIPMTPADEPVIVAVIDTGVDVFHEALCDYVTDGWNFPAGTADIYEVGNPLDSAHGTHISGIISESAGMAGADIRILPLKVFQDGFAYTSDIIAAIEYASAAGASVINCSFGSTAVNRALYEAMESCPALFVCAAGNKRTSLDITPVYPAAYSLPNVISVGSANMDGGYSYFSNYSTDLVDIAALGRDVLSCLPQSRYGIMSGTSMAAAQVSGAAAVLAFFNGIEGEALSELIRNSGDQLSNLQNKVADGRRLNLENALNGIFPEYVMQNDPADDFDVHGYQPEQSEAFELYSAAGEVIKAEAGGTHTLVLKENGTVWAWGDNSYGQIGAAVDSGLLPLSQVYGLSNVIEISAGYSHNLALKSDGTVWAWGYNVNGQLGVMGGYYFTVPVQVYGLTDIAAISAGSYHSLAATADGEVWAWGYNAGRLGDGTTIKRETPVPVAGGLTDIVAVSAGESHSLALESDGTVWAWGYNQNGQLGIGSTAQSLYPAEVSGITAVTDISAGYNHSIVRTQSGAVWAWGDNYYGQLGDGTKTDRLSPVQINEISGVTGLSTGYYYSLAIKTDGTAYGWGLNSYGQLGNGTRLGAVVPTQIPGLADCTGVSAGSAFGLALDSNGEIWAWGDNYCGQLGDGASRLRTSPVYVAGISDAVDVAAGAGFSLALKADGTVWAWGDNYYGQLGDATAAPGTVPAPVFGLTEVVDISAGESFSLALKSDGTVWGWGDNRYGQLGNTLSDSSFVPIQVEGLADVKSISAGGIHALALLEDGTVWGWGDNSCGQLGRMEYDPSPAPVSGLEYVAKISAGGYHSLFLLEDGTVWACGDNSCGQLGTDVWGSSYEPVQVTDFNEAYDISAGNTHSLAEQHGKVWAWGDNFYGQLGTDEISGWSNYPIMMGDDIFNAWGVFAGGTHSFAIQHWAGCTEAWGGNWQGQLGNGTTEDSFYSTMGHGYTFTHISAGAEHTLALTQDGYVMAWGSNNAFELGVPWSDAHLAPIQAQTEPDDYSDFPGMETPFSIPMEVPGVVNALYDKDWFAFAPDETGEYTVSLTSQNSNLILEMYLSDYTPIPLPPNGRLTLEGNQLYYIKVYYDREQPFTRSPYTLSVFPVDPSADLIGQKRTFAIKAENVTSFAGKTFTLTYNASVLELTDFAAQAGGGSVTPGAVDGTGLTIISHSGGVLTFSVNTAVPPMFSWNGVVTVATFNVLSGGDAGISVS